MQWNVQLIRQSNWLNICSCFIVILKWALSLCMPGMRPCLLAFLIEAHCGVYISIDFNCMKIQVISFKVKYSNFSPLSVVWTALKVRVGKVDVSRRERGSWWLEWKHSGIVLAESIQTEFSAACGSRGRSRGKAMCGWCIQVYKNLHGLPSTHFWAKGFTSMGPSSVPRFPFWVYYLDIICVHAWALIIFNNHFLDAVTIASNSLTNKEKITMFLHFFLSLWCRHQKKDLKGRRQCKMKNLKREESIIFGEIMKITTDITKAGLSLLLLESV